MWANIHAGVLHTLRDIHSFVPQTLAPTAPICAVLYKVGVRGVAKTPCNLAASDRDKILASEAEEVVKSGKRLLCKCGGPSVTHRCHRGRKSQMV